MTIASACTQNNDYQPIGDLSGEVSISLQTEDFVPQSKASVEVGVPEVDDLTVEIFKISGLENVRLYKDSYLNTKGSAIKLNCADYLLSAHYGDSLAVGEDRAYYEAVVPFTLEPENRSIEVSAVARVANVRVSVEYGENLLYDYPEFYSVIRSVTPGGRNKKAEFYQDHTDRKVFVPYGTLYYELYAKIEGEWKYFPAQPLTPERGDDITFKVETSRQQGQHGITVVVAQPDKEDKLFDVPSDMLPQGAPVVSTEMLPELVVTEGDELPSEMKMNLVADGNIKECWLNVESDYLASMGIPERIDLASASITPEVKSALENIGIKWMNSMAGRRFAYVDFSGLVKFMSENQCDPDNLLNATFSLDLVDQRHNPGQTNHWGTSSTDKYTFRQGVPAPSLSIAGFENGPVSLMEGTGVTVDGLKASIVAKGRIGHCYLDITSSYITAQGVPSRVDLAHVDETTAQKLRSFGISWPSDMSSRTVAEVDFSDVSDYMERSMYKASYGENFAKFSLTVMNEVTLDQQNNQAVSSGADFKYLLPSATVTTIQDHNVWAKKIYDFSVDLTEGNPKQVKLQYSANGGAWTDITYNIKLEGTVLNCSKLATVANTVYDIRAIYHNNPDLCVGFNRVKTESEAQVPNSDFESWTQFTHKFTALGGFIGGGSQNYIWHRPYSGSDKVWDINAKISMPEEQTGWTNFNVKCFPCAGRSTDCLSGSYSALIFVVNVGASNTNDVATGTRYTGELFIGSASDDGTPTYGTTPFPSRPTSLRIHYKYLPDESETFTGNVKIYSGEQVIAEASFDNGAASRVWTSRTLPLTYTDTTLKATHASISFKASKSASGVDVKSSIEYDGGSYTGHFGSQLRLDNLQFIYEY